MSFFVKKTLGGGLALTLAVTSLMFLAPLVATDAMAADDYTVITGEGGRGEDSNGSNGGTGQQGEITIGTSPSTPGAGTGADGNTAINAGHNGTAVDGTDTVGVDIGNVSLTGAIGGAGGTGGATNAAGGGGDSADFTATATGDVNAESLTLEGGEGGAGGAGSATNSGIVGGDGGYGGSVEFDADGHDLTVGGDVELIGGRGGQRGVAHDTSGYGDGGAGGVGGSATLKAPKLVASGDLLLTSGKYGLAAVTGDDQTTAGGDAGAVAVVIEGITPSSAGNGGEGVLEARNIDVQAWNEVARINVTGGDANTTGTGGAASVTANGTTTVTVSGDKEAQVTALGGTGAGGASGDNMSGGTATLNLGDVTISTTAAAVENAIVSAEGGEAGAYGQGGAADITAGNVTVTGLGGDNTNSAYFIATGGLGGSAAGNGGSATLQATSISASNGQATPGGSVLIGSKGGGAAYLGAGGTASVTVSGATQVTVSGAFLAQVAAEGGAGVGGASGDNMSGGTATMDLGDVTVSTAATATNKAGVYAAGGLAGVYGQGGAADITAGIVTVTGLGGDNTTSASFTAAGGLGGTTAGNGGSATLQATSISASNGPATTQGGAVEIGSKGGSAANQGAGGTASVTVSGATQVTVSDAFLAQVAAEGGAGAGGASGDNMSGGTATMVLGDVTVSTEDSATAVAEVFALGGTAGSFGQGGAADITAGIVTVNGLGGSGAYSASLVALGGESTEGVGGSATLLAAAITVTTDAAATQGGEAVVGSLGGTPGTSGAGGAASVTSTGPIDLSVKGANDASVLSTAGTSKGAGFAGAAGAIDTGGISITALAGALGTYTVEATGGNTDSGLGGLGSVVSRSDVLLTNGATGAATLVTGAKGGDSADGDGGDAYYEATSVTLNGTGAGASTVTLNSIGGAAGTDGLGGQGKLWVPGAVKVLAEGGAAVTVNVASGASAGTNRVGVESVLDVDSLVIEASETGNANVNVTGGNATGTANGGDAVVDVAGDLIIKGADDATGDAALTLTGGTSGSGHAGWRNVTVGGTLALTSGTDTGTTYAGDASFVADKLYARNIDLVKKAGALTFNIMDELDVTRGDTSIYIDGTNTPTIDTATIGGGNLLAITGLDDTTDTINVDWLRVAPNDSGRLYVADPDNLALTNLDIQEATVTLVLPQGIGDGDTFLDVGNANLTDSIINLAGDLEGLSRGDEIKLIVAGTTTGAPDNINAPLEAAMGVTRLMGYTLSMDGDDLVTTIDSQKAHPRAKALSEGRLAGSAFINQAGDLLADAGIPYALRAADQIAGPAVFSAITYGDSRYETGSHVDVRGLSAILGVAYGFDLAPGVFTLGGFLEYGTGSYDSFNEFAGYDSVRGEGDTDYFGGGLLARMDFKNHGSGSFHLELAARAGRVSTDFISNDFPVIASYDVTTTYYGLQVGAGHVFNLSESTDLDLYAKYFWTHQQGKNVTVPDPVSFDDVNSHRVRAGARLSHRLTDAVGLYVGAAYEGELDGEAAAHSYGFALDVPELKGSMGIGELGLTAVVAEKVNLDFGLQGYAGDRRGVSGGIRLNVKF